MKGFDRKLFFGILFMLLLFLPVLGVAIYSLHVVVADQDELIATYAEELLLAKDLRRETIQQNALVPVYVLTGDPALLAEFDRTHEEFFATLSAIEAKAIDEKSKRMLNGIRLAQEELHRLAQPGIEMKRRGAPTAQVNAYFRDNSAARSEALSRALDEFVDHVTHAYEVEKASNTQTSRRLIKFLAVAAALAVLFCLVVTGLLWKLVRQRREYDAANERLSRRERELSRSRKETLEVVAHDLKNPLASILMTTQLALRKRARDPAAADETDTSLELTLRSAQSMKRLIDDLLDHAKIESGSLGLVKKECQLDALLTHLAARLQPLAANKGLRLETEICAPLPAVSVDEGRMEQVISNLVGNSIKFTPAGGSIRVCAKAGHGYLTIAVSDTGPGMSADQLTHIFERYWQARGTAHQGTGLGLAITKAIVQAHEGKIWVESMPGRGSTFYVAIPTKLAERKLAIPDFSSSPANPSHGPSPGSR